MRSRLAVSLAALSLTAAACGGGSSPTGKAAAAFELTDQTPPAKGELASFTWSTFAEPYSIDYAYAFDYPSNTILSNVCESLLRWNPDLTTSPALAEKVTNPDPKTWVYAIRPGVKFHDGSELTAKDVAASLNRHLTPDVGSYWSSVYRNVVSVKQTGPLQVTVKLKQPDALFNQYMAASPGTIESAASLAAAGKDYGNPKKGVNCTGPFSFGSWTPGRDLVLQRFDGYWDPALKAKSAQVKFVFLPDSNARVSAFQSGEVDGGWMLPPNAFATLQSGSAGKLYFGRNTTTANEVISNLDGPLGNPKVRQALLMAIDREGMIKAGAAGIADLADSLAAPTTWGGAPEARKGITPYPYDPAKARTLAAEAGVKGQKVVIATSSLDVETGIITQAISQAATEIGLKPEITTLSADKYGALFTDPEARKGVDMFLTFWYTSITDPLDIYANVQSGNFANYGGWSDKTYDAAVDKALAADDVTARRALTADVQEIATRELPWLPLYAAPVNVFVGKKITGVKPSIAYMYYPWAAEIGSAE
ncbi:glutathione ABC transporter substrate-binding protein GsiB [Actinocorallia lasiicapitis]